MFDTFILMTRVNYLDYPLFAIIENIPEFFDAFDRKSFI